MRVKITPSVAVGEVMVPPSKSMAHRALICAALSVGSYVENLAWSDDITATLICLQKMGAAVERTADGVRIGGMDPFALPAGPVLPCNESGSTLRFLLPLCMLGGVPVTLTGSPRLFERPLDVYEDICRQQGIPMTKTATSVTVCGRLSAGEYAVTGEVSSQFISGLLFALPLLKGDSKLTVTGRFESASYVDLTLSALRTFGIAVERQDNTFFIKGGQAYSAADYAVEGDCSNAAFLEGFNLLKGDVKANGLSVETLQGDRVYAEFYRRLQNGERHFDLSDCPDLAPVLFALAAACGGGYFTGTARLRMKESDRAAVMAEELAKFGVAVTVGENYVEISDGRLQPPTEVLCGHNDHRVVMALSLLCSVTGGIIDGAEAVAKSYPNYFEVIKSLQIGLTTDET